MFVQIPEKWQVAGIFPTRVRQRLEEACLLGGRGPGSRHTHIRGTGPLFCADACNKGRRLWSTRERLDKMALQTVHDNKYRMSPLVRVLKPLKQASATWSIEFLKHPAA